MFGEELNMFEVVQPETQRGFEIRCVSCGALIRRDMVTDSPRLCLSCFYQYLSQHLCEQKQARAGDGVSER